MAEDTISLDAAYGAEPASPASAPAAPVTWNGFTQDPRNNTVWRGPDGAIGYLGSPATTTTSPDGQLVVGINGTSHPDVIAAFAKAHPDLAAVPQALGAASAPAAAIPGVTGAGPQTAAPSPAPAPDPDQISVDDAYAGSPPAETRPTSEGLGFLEGLMKPFDNVAHWANKALPINIPGLPTTDQAIANHQQAFATAEQAQKPGFIGQLAGNVAGTLPVAAALPEAAIGAAASRLPLIGGMAARALPVLAQGAAGAAALSDHPDNGLSVAGDAAAGALGGYVGGKLLGGLGRVLSPKVNPDVALLASKGVPLTPGQVVGGTLQRVEDALKSYPALGDSIREAQRRGMGGFVNAVGNDALSHIGESIPASVTPGRGTVAHVANRLGEAYDAIKPQLSAAIDGPFVNGVAKIRADISPEALDALPTFDRIVRDEILQRAKTPDLATGTDMVPYGVTAPGKPPRPAFLNGQAAKDAQTAIGQEIAGLAPSADPKTRAVVRGLKGLQDELTGSLMRNSAPGASSRLADINAGYAKYARLRDASAATSEKDGGLFTPNQFTTAVRKGDKSVGKGSFAKGGALMQDLAAAGQRVLPSTVPDSGTAMRMLVSELPMLIGFGAESAHFAPHLAGTLLAGGVAGLPYTQVGQRAATKLMTQRPWTPAASKAVIAALRPYMIDASAVGGQRAGAKALPQLPAR